ncbi:MAG TPA: translation initiation factor IF-1 [Verrucomicrobiae bacterium]|jgi:translation initiation factor IF-1|nr:translation initiation factor IF-1 [Verrucomicrobiae bacterium]
MAGESAFKVEGIVIETMPNRLFRVELSNGHKVLAYATGKAKETFAAKVGDKVKLQMSPYDLSEGRIIVETKQI